MAAKSKPRTPPAANERQRRKLEAVATTIKAMTGVPMARICLLPTASGGERLDALLVPLGNGALLAGIAPVMPTSASEGRSTLRSTRPSPRSAGWTMS